LKPSSKAAEAKLNVKGAQMSFLLVTLVDLSHASHFSGRHGKGPSGGIKLKRSYTEERKHHG